MAKAQESCPCLHKRHEAVKKELSQVRKDLTKDTRETARREYFHDEPVNRQIKQLLSQSNVENCKDVDSNSKDWDIPILEYVFPERARLMENFYGPEVECFNADKLTCTMYPGY